MSSLPLKLTKPPLRYPKPLYQPFDVKQFHFLQKIVFFQFWHSQLNFHELFLKLDWLDSDLIPRLLEIFENFKKKLFKKRFFFNFDQVDHIYFTIELYDDLRTGRDDLADRELENEHDFWNFWLGWKWNKVCNGHVVMTSSLFLVRKSDLLYTVCWKTPNSEPRLD